MICLIRFVGLAAGCLDDIIGQTDRSKAWKARSEVHFDLDQYSVDAEKRACVGFGDHTIWR